MDRGAENAFIAVAQELSIAGDEVTLIGSGGGRTGNRYKFIHASSVARERFEDFPSLPFLRNEYCYEELTFAPHLIWRFRPSDYDITVTCSYPFTNWILRRPVLWGVRPPHVFVTHNGDWAPLMREAEYRFFGCDGLICINPDFFERNKKRWHSRLIPNGVDCERFKPGAAQRELFGLPEGRLLVLMVSALIPNKRIEFGIEAVSQISNAHLVVAGDGPLRETLTSLASKLLPNRFTLLSTSPDRMPQLYRTADVFLQTSKDEPFPLVFLEALACGVPIVAHDMQRVRWFIGEDQYLADMTDPKAIAQAIIRAQQFGRSGLDARVRLAAQFSWTNVARLYRDFFQEVINGARTHNIV